MQLTINDVLKVIGEMQSEANDAQIIFPSNRVLKFKSEVLEELGSRLIDVQLKGFEDALNAMYKVDSVGFYETLSKAHSFAHSQGFRLQGGFVQGRFRFVRLQEVVCA